MDFILRPWPLFFLILSGLMNRRQQEIIECQNAQIPILMDKMGRRRILLSDQQRRVLAVKAKALGRRALMELTTIEVWTRDGLTTLYILVAMCLKTRCVEIAGVTANPDGIWTEQMARNLTASRGFIDGASHLLIDRDTKFQQLRTYLNDMTDTDVVLLPPRSPNLNAHLERYMRSMKSECLNRMIFFGRRSLERALEEFVTHYHTERNHQGLGNRIIDPGEEIGDVECRERLGGMLRYYHREAA
ncbi:MAG: putative transposase [Verrucomicrobiales bacterium]|jgi:putative transposase